MQTTLSVYRRALRRDGHYIAATLAAEHHASLSLQGEAERLAWDALRELLDAGDHDAQPRLLTLRSADDVQTMELAPVLIEGVMRECELGMLVGAAKTRKTWIALDLALAMTSGGRWMDGIGCGEPRNVLYVDAEASPAVVGDRLRLLSIDRRPPPLADLRILSTRGHSPGTVGIAAEMLCQGIAQCDAHLCIVDTLSAFLPLENENDNAEATRAMSALVRVCEDMQCAILLVHHTPKGGGAGRAAIDAAAGAGAFTRRVDTCLAVREEDGETYLDVRARSFESLNRAAITFDRATMQPRCESAPDTLHIPLPTVRPRKNVLAKSRD